jgi:hypothetical protein
LLGLRGIVLARRLGLYSALPAPSQYLPDPDLSEIYIPVILRALARMWDAPRPGPGGGGPEPAWRPPRLGPLPPDAPLRRRPRPHRPRHGTGVTGAARAVAPPPRSR